MTFYVVRSFVGSIFCMSFYSFILILLFLFFLSYSCFFCWKKIHTYLPILNTTLIGISYQSLSGHNCHQFLVIVIDRLLWMSRDWNILWETGFAWAMRTTSNRNWMHLFALHGKFFAKVGQSQNWNYTHFWNDFRKDGSWMKFIYLHQWQGWET